MNTDDAKICDQFQNQFDLCELGLSQLKPDQRKLLERHFESCKPCQKWLADWELIKLNTREMTQLEVPDSVLAGVMKGLEPGRAALPMLPKSDLLWAGAGLCVLFLTSIFYAAEGAEGAISWGLSFVLLLLAHYVLNLQKPGVAV